jgi:hypothetical protein
MRTWTRDQQNAAWRKWYSNNAARKIGWQRRRREEIRQWWRELKATKSCQVCGERAPECLHFHHRDPSQKAIDLGTVASSGRWSRERILEEVAKCDVLCANCHAKHHWDERLLLK